MATAPLKHKTAIDDVLDDFDEIIDHASRTMSDEEFKQAENKFKEIASAPPSRSRRRETA